MSQECECGCGETIPIKSHGVLIKFKHGHNRRGLVSNWKGGKYRTYHGYIMVMRKGHIRADKDGYVREHILVYEDYYECCIPVYSDVHHINGIKDDNSVDNLEAMIHGRHSSIHRIRELDSGKILFGGKNRASHIVTTI